MTPVHLRRGVAALGLAVAAVIGVATTTDARPGTARLVIRASAPGNPGLEFRTRGLSAGAFTLRDGQQRVFKNLPPGRYVVVQAPPQDGWGQRIQCSDGKSSNQYDLVGGSTLTCTFFATPV